MRQSLAMGVHPRFSANHEFPKVPLGKGLWRVETEHRKDTKLSVLVFTPTDGPNGGKFDVPSEFELKHDECVVVNGPAHVRVVINEPGNEAYISVVAVKHD